MGQVTQDSPAAGSTVTTLLTPRNLLIGAVIGVGSYYAWQNRGKSEMTGTNS
jgi:hypothetical protein